MGVIRVEWRHDGALHLVELGLSRQADSEPNQEMTVRSEIR